MFCSRQLAVGRKVRAPDGDIVQRAVVRDTDKRPGKIIHHSTAGIGVLFDGDQLATPVPGKTIVPSEDPIAPTPLLHATWCGRKKNVKLLLKHKADLLDTGRYGNALQVARMKHNTGLIQILSKAMEAFTPVQHTLIYKTNLVETIYFVGEVI